jgi:hypothetical protein
VVRSSHALQKFWNRRHLYFSRFSGDGHESAAFHDTDAPGTRVFSDVAGYFMVTPEEISAHQAAACSASIVVDATAGIGGVTVHLGRTCDHVIAVEMDAVRAAIVAHNCSAYGVGQYVDVILGDFLCVSARFKADVVLITPPYGHMSLPQSTNLTETPYELQSASLGGKSYASNGSFDLRHLPVDITKFVSVARRIAPSYVLVLPRYIIPHHPIIIPHHRIAQTFVSRCPASRDVVSALECNAMRNYRNIDPAHAAGLAVDGPWRCELNKHCGASHAISPVVLRHNVVRHQVQVFQSFTRCIAGF